MLAAVMATILVLEAQLAVALAGSGGRLDAEVGQADRSEGAACHQLRSCAAAGGRGQGLGQTIKP